MDRLCQCPYAPRYHSPDCPVMDMANDVRAEERKAVAKWLKKQRPSIAGAYRMVPLEDIEALERGEAPAGWPEKEG